MCFSWLVVWSCGSVRDFVVLLLRVWLVVAGVCCVSCLCSSVGSVLFWVVRCFVVLLVLLLLCFVCGCSSGWLWWLCCSVRFFAPGGVAPLFWLLVCFPSCALHRPGVGCSWLVRGCFWFVCCSSGSFGGSWFGCFTPPLFAGVRSCSWFVFGSGSLILLLVDLVVVCPPGGSVSCFFFMTSSATAGVRWLSVWLCLVGLVFCFPFCLVSEEFVDSVLVCFFCSDFVCSLLHSVFLLFWCCCFVFSCFVVLLLVFVSFFPFFWSVFLDRCASSFVVVVSAFWQSVVSVPFVLCLCSCFLSVASVCSASDVVLYYCVSVVLSLPFGC